MTLIGNCEYANRSSSLYIDTDWLDAPSRAQAIDHSSPPSCLMLLSPSSSILVSAVLSTYGMVTSQAFNTSTLCFCPWFRRCIKWPLPLPLTKTGKQTPISRDIHLNEPVWRDCSELFSYTYLSGRRTSFMPRLNKYLASAVFIVAKFTVLAEFPRAATSKLSPKSTFEKAVSCRCCRQKLSFFR